jgi:hypothetical protein
MMDILPALKVPRQCPLVPLVRVDYREVNALRNSQFVATQQHLLQIIVFLLKDEGLGRVLTTVVCNFAI